MCSLHQKHLGVIQKAYFLFLKYYWWKRALILRDNITPSKCNHHPCFRKNTSFSKRLKKPPLPHFCITHSWNKQKKFGMTGLSEARIHILPCIEHSSLLFFCNSYHATENAHGAIAFTQTVLELITFGSTATCSMRNYFSLISGSQQAVKIPFPAVTTYLYCSQCPQLCRPIPKLPKRLFPPQTTAGTFSNI